MEDLKQYKEFMGKKMFNMEFELDQLREKLLVEKAKRIRFERILLTRFGINLDLDFDNDGNMIEVDDANLNLIQNENNMDLDEQGQGEGQDQHQEQLQLNREVEENQDQVEVENDQNGIVVDQSQNHQEPDQDQIIIEEITVKGEGLETEDDKEKENIDQDQDHTPKIEIIQIDDDEEVEDNSLFAPEIPKFNTDATAGVSQPQHQDNNYLIQIRQQQGSSNANGNNTNPNSILGHLNAIENVGKTIRKRKKKPAGFEEHNPTRCTRCNKTFNNAKLKRNHNKRVHSPPQKGVSNNQ